MTLRLITWNVNSIRIRLDHLARIVSQADPHVICLQETKVVDDLFPRADIEAMGFPHQHIYGIKGYNGVAILSRLPLVKTGRHDWCGRQDGRHVSACVEGGGGRELEVHSLYVPAGGDVPDPESNPKFAHKLEFLSQTTAWFGKYRSGGGPMILAGDLNVAPLETDVWSHKQLLGVVTHTPVEVAYLEELQDSASWIDAVRQFIPPEEPLYSWWSYRAQDWKKNNRGRRLDHVWANEPLRGSLADASVMTSVRDWTQPSDHVPVVVDLKF